MIQGQDLYYIKDSTKSFDQAVSDATVLIKEHKFGTLHVHDIGTLLRSKGQSFEEKCHVFEVCNPVHAAKVLAADIRVNMALPCRVSIYTDKGATKIGMIRPGMMLSMMSEDPTLQEVAMEAERLLCNAIDAIANDEVAPAAPADASKN